MFKNGKYALPRLILFLDVYLTFSLVADVTINNPVILGVFIGFPTVFLLDYLLSLAELFPRWFHQVLTSNPLVVSIHDVFFENINLQILMNMGIMVLTIFFSPLEIDYDAWSASPPLGKCYDPYDKKEIEAYEASGDLAKYEALPLCETEVGVLQWTTDTFFFALLTIDVLAGIFEICIITWVYLSLVFGGHYVMTVSAYIRGHYSTIILEDSALIYLMVAVVAGLINLVGKCCDRIMRGCDDHIGVVLFFEAYSLIVFAPGVILVYTLNYIWEDFCRKIKGADRALPFGLYWLHCFTSSRIFDRAKWLQEKGPHPLVCSCMKVVGAAGEEELVTGGDGDSGEQKTSSGVEITQTNRPQALMRVDSGTIV